MALFRSAHPTCTSAPVSLLREKPSAAIGKLGIKMTTPDSLWTPLFKQRCTSLCGVCRDLRNHAGKIMPFVTMTEEIHLSPDSPSGKHSTDYDTSCFGRRPQPEMSHSGHRSAAQSSLMDPSTRSEMGEEPKKRK